MNTSKTCLVTGCSTGGVGASLAEAFKDNGYHVYATARSPSKMPSSFHEASNVTVLTLDVTSSESIAAAAERVRRETGGRLDVLINNAGLGLELPALDTPIAEARRVFDSNFFAVLEMIQVFSPMLIEARGCIVNNSSVGGRIPIPFCSTWISRECAMSKTNIFHRHIQWDQGRSYPGRRGLASRARTTWCASYHFDNRRSRNELPQESS
jgi:NAD(P)-dependent dehydrogenase (short-subunit alcohol dehydrogenase family)